MDSTESLTTRQLIETLIVENRIKVAAVHESIETVAGDVSSLAKILRDGNGTPPITVRMALVEKLASDTAIVVRDMDEQREKTKETATARRWQIVLMFATTILSCIGTIIAAITAAGLKHP